MMKKLLLSLVPAFMLLGSCAGTAPQNKAELLREDNLAHEEVFGDAQEVGNLEIKKAHRNAAADLITPKIGVQYKKSDENDDENTTISIRYVAAIGTLNVTANWVRAMDYQNRTTGPKQKYDDEKKEYNYKESKKAYAELNNSGIIVKATDLGEGYNYFVVYTLLDIPYNTYKYCYMAAYLELTDNEDNKVESDVVAVEVGQDHHCFSFSNDTNGYFIEGTINGNANQKVDLDEDPGDNHAKKTLELKGDDNFGLFRWTPTDFNFYGHTDFAYDNYYMTQETTISSNYSEVGVDHEYYMFVNNSDEFGLLPTSNITIDLYLDAAGIWNKDGARFALCAFEGGDKWFNFTLSSGSLYVCSGFDITANNSIILCRMNGADLENKWDNKWNQTADIYFNTSYIKNNKFTITHIDGAYERTEYVPTT